MEEIKWWHSVPLGDGRVTPGLSPFYKVEKNFLFDEIDFRGKSVLDVGAWDGYFSFTAEKRGAKRVLALDDPDFRWGGMDGFNFLHEHFESSVQWMKGTVYHLPEEMFDIVLCYGVLYHLSDPLLAATNCFQKSKDLVLIEGLMYKNKMPQLSLLEPKILNNDNSNIYAMSTAYLIMVGRLNGFKLVKHVQMERNRGAMMFKAARKIESPYVPTCFPFLPATANETNDVPGAGVAYDPSKEAAEKH